MNEFIDSEFIEAPTIETFFKSLDYEQKLAFAAFYRTFCKAPYGEPPTHLDDRPGNFPYLIGNIFTTDATAYSLNARHGAVHEDPYDYLLVAAQVRNGEMQVNELEILRIQHAPSDTREGIDKIIDAKWHETSKLTRIRMGNKAIVLTKDQDGVVTHSLPLNFL